MECNGRTVSRKKPFVMNFPKLLSLTAILFSYATPAIATKPWHTGGSPAFGMNLILSSEPVRPGVYRLIVDCWSVRHAPAVMAKARVFMPGIKVLSGDIERNLHPSIKWSGEQDSRWEILFKGRPGTFQVRGTLSIGSSIGVVDETDCAVTCMISAEGRPSREPSRATRFERVEYGQRFRYGGSHMVAIDNPESITWADIVTRATVLTSPAGTCRKCGPVGRRSVRLVITVGRDGKVRWVQPSGEVAQENEGKLLTAARQTIKTWTFVPAHTKDGTPVNTAMELDVPIEIVE